MGYLPPRAGCPDVRKRRAVVLQVREALSRLGFRPVRLHNPWSPYIADVRSAGKVPTIERRNGKNVSWTDGHSWAHLSRVTEISTNTGVLLGGNMMLVALDIDPKGESDEARRRFAFSVLEVLKSTAIGRHVLQHAIIRRRDPGSVLIVFRTDTLMTKRKVKGEHGAVELLGQGEHVVVEGHHPKSLDGKMVCWYWHGGRAPWTVPAADLPVVAVSAVLTLLHTIQTSGVLGPAVTAASGGSTRGSVGRHGSAYEATERLRTLLTSYDGRVKPAVRELVQQIGAEAQGRHDAVVAICGRLVSLQWTLDMVSEFLVPLINNNFGDGDWTEEIVAAFEHARRRQLETLKVGRRAE